MVRSDTRVNRATTMIGKGQKERDHEENRHRNNDGEVSGRDRKWAEAQIMGRVVKVS